jgi:hypothetical protein
MAEVRAKRRLACPGANDAALPPVDATEAVPASSCLMTVTGKGADEFATSFGYVAGVLQA